MKKINASRWTAWLLAGMLHALCLAPWVFAEPDGESAGRLTAELHEARLARQAAEQQSADLRAQLTQSTADLKAARRQLAEVYVKAQAQARDFSEYQVRVAGLLADQQDGGSAAALTEALVYLEQMHRHHVRLCEQVRAFSSYLETFLDVVEPSDAVRRDILGRSATLMNTVVRLERLPSIVAGRGGEKTGTRREGRVLAVNDDLHVVVVDVGSVDGVRPGSVWRVLDETMIRAKIVIVDVRPGISGAVPIEGKLKAIAPGMQVKAGPTGVNHE